MNNNMKFDVYIKYLDLNQDIIRRISKIGFFIKGFSITLISIVISLVVNKNISYSFYIFFSFIWIFIWWMDVINLRNEKIFRRDYDYKRMHWKEMDEEEILDLSYSFKGNNKDLLKKSIFNIFTSIHLFFVLFFSIYCFILLF